MSAQNPTLVLKILEIACFFVKMRLFVSFYHTKLSVAVIFRMTMENPEKPDLEA